MSRIYVVRTNADGSVARYVRAGNLNAAVRAVADEMFAAKPATTDEVYIASKLGTLDVLDATGERAPSE